MVKGSISNRATLVLQLADVVDNEAMQVYMKPPAHEEAKSASSKGFVVRDAPWAAGNTEKVGSTFWSVCQFEIVGVCVCFGVYINSFWRSFILTLSLMRCTAAVIFAPIYDFLLFCSQAPDMSSSEDFPSFGAQVAPKTLPWGPKR